MIEGAAYGQVHCSKYFWNRSIIYHTLCKDMSSIFPSSTQNTPYSNDKILSVFSLFALCTSSFAIASSCPNCYINFQLHYCSHLCIRVCMWARERKRETLCIKLNNFFMRLNYFLNEKCPPGCRIIAECGCLEFLNGRFFFNCQQLKVFCGTPFWCGSRIFLSVQRTNHMT